MVERNLILINKQNLLLLIVEFVPTKVLDVEVAGKDTIEVQGITGP